MQSLLKEAFLVAFYKELDAFQSHLLIRVIMFGFLQDIVVKILEFDMV